ncbi:MAG: DUF424 family protein [Promethearchaeota archaeon]|nr:MAG: DUF424 family protein [Candidatus Lokiarchaeota archaeon]
MRVYLKVHTNPRFETIACCDEKLLNKIVEEGNLRIEITERFFGGTLMEIDQAIEILLRASYFNIVGADIINKAIVSGIVPKEGVRTINGIPMAIKMMF